MAFAQVTSGFVSAIKEGAGDSSWLPCGSAVVVGWVYQDGEFEPPSLSVAPPQPAPTPAQIAAALAATTIAGGLNITSTSTPALNGNYALGLSSQAAINAIVTYVLLNNTFPGNMSSIAWADSLGGSHVFPNVALFKAFATAVADFVTTVSIYGDSGGRAGSIPANNVTII